MLIKKGGCCLNCTIEQYNKVYKVHGYKIVEEDKKDLDEMTYKELQALYKIKTGNSPIGKKKADILEELNEVV